MFYCWAFMNTNSIKYLTNLPHISGRLYIECQEICSQCLLRLVNLGNQLLFFIVLYSIAYN